jgi:hypothetical protein
MYMRQPRNVDAVDREMTSATSTAIASLEENDKTQSTVTEVAVAEVVAHCSQVEESVRVCIKISQQKQTAEYNARKRKGKSILSSVTVITFKAENIDKYCLDKRDTCNGGVGHDFMSRTVFHT